MAQTAAIPLTGVQTLIMAPYRPGMRLQDFFKRADAPQKIIVPWPELNRPWPEPSAIVFASGSTNKYRDDRQALSWFAPAFIAAQRFFDDTLPDSEELESDSVQIAHQKIITTVIEPWAKLRSSYIDEALMAAGVPSTQHIAVLSEDREVIIDPIIRTHPIFDLYRNSDGLIGEAFAADGEFFGIRTKELMKAVGGPAVLLDMVEKAKRDLRAQKYTVSDNVDLGIAFCLKPLKPGLLPLPEDGIFIYVREYGANFSPITNADRKLHENGNDSDMDHYEVPSDFVGQRDPKGQPITIESLRANGYSPDYHNYRSPTARALRQMATVLKFPKLDVRKEFGLQPMPNARLLDSFQIGEFSEPVKTDSTLAGHPQSLYGGPIKDLSDIELAAWHCEGVIFNNTRNAQDYDDPVKRAIVQFEQRLLFSYFGALTPHGGFIGTGRPVMVEDERYQTEFAYLSNFHNQGAAAGLSSDVFTRFVGENGNLSDILREGRWDMERFKPNPANPPVMHMPTEQEICQLLEIENATELGFVWAALGSASSKIPSGQYDAKVFARAAGVEGITCISGGGTREVMQQFFNGYIEAYLEGCNRFRKIGVRVPVVSRHEGSMREFLYAWGLEAEIGNFDDPYFATLDNHLHIIEQKFMAERQHLIYMLAHAGVYFIGGIGTDYEFNSNAYHNLMVERRGYGIFPGSPLNTQKKPLFLVNSPVLSGGPGYGYFNKYLSFISPEIREMIGLQVFDRPDMAFAAMVSYARTLGYDIPFPDSDRVFMPPPPGLSPDL